MSRFLPVFVAAVFLAATAAAQTGTWQIDPNHSSAQFSARHLGVSTVRGAFTKVTGTLRFDPADPSKDVVDVTIDAASIDTRVEARDNDLRSSHFLDVQKYPSLTFHSKQVRSSGEGKLQVSGDLTIHGVTKEVVLDVDGPTAPIKDPMGSGQRIGASATTSINRTDFGVNGAPAPIVGNDIPITIDVELIQPQSK